MTASHAAMEHATVEPAAADQAQFRARLEDALATHDQYLADEPEPNDISVGLHRRHEAARAEVVAALSRLDAGTYGVCESCGEAVSHERLDAMPHTRLCRDCA